MYIPEPKKKCSKCKSIQHPETVHRDDKTYLRCRECGHEKLIASLTFVSSTAEQIAYTFKLKKDGEEEF